MYKGGFNNILKIKRYLTFLNFISELSQWMRIEDDEEEMFICTDRFIQTENICSNKLKCFLCSWKVSNLL